MLSANNKIGFIIGTGASLNKIDMHKLKGQRTMTFNRAYIAFDDWGFDPSYYLCIDGNDLRSYYKDINNLIKNSAIEKFFLYKLTDNQKHVKECFQDNDYRDNDDIYELNKKVFLFNDTLDGKLDYPLLDDFSVEGNILTTSVVCNAGFVGLKTMYHLGYRKICLLGMDARYVDDSKYRDVGVHGNSYKARSDDDANHFRKDYFGKDIMFGASNQEVIIQIWKSFMELVKPVLYPDLEIISCSENSNLNAFIPYLPFEQYMENLNQKNK